MRRRWVFRLTLESFVGAVFPRQVLVNTGFKSRMMRAPDTIWVEPLGICPQWTQTLVKLEISNFSSFSMAKTCKKQHQQGLPPKSDPRSNPGREWEGQTFATLFRSPFFSHPQDHHILGPPIAPPYQTKANPLDAGCNNKKHYPHTVSVAFKSENPMETGHEPTGYWYLQTLQNLRVFLRTLRQWPIPLWIQQRTQYRQWLLIEFRIHLPGIRLSWTIATNDVQCRNIQTMFLTLNWGFKWV